MIESLSGAASRRGVLTGATLDLSLPDRAAVYGSASRLKDTRFPQNAAAFRLPHEPAPPVA
ncbi:hypothetical protein SAMN03159406_04137 [Rhizobium sp. NFR03]|nr:hypothetical protein SAMN03159406_04137 [Rhizobium sp. NFR03]